MRQHSLPPFDLHPFAVASAQHGHPSRSLLTIIIRDKHSYLDFALHRRRKCTTWSPSLPWLPNQPATPFSTFLPICTTIAVARAQQLEPITSIVAKSQSATSIPTFLRSAQPSSCRCRCTVTIAIDVFDSLLLLLYYCYCWCPWTFLLIDCCCCYNELSFWLIVVVLLYCILLVHA